VGWDIPNPANGILLVLQISVSIKDLFRFGRWYPWPRPERCPRCGHGRLWGHGFVSAYFDDYEKPLWLRRYRCPLCRLILRLRPAGYFSRVQASVETIRQSLAYRFYHHLWPPGSSRQRQGYWFELEVVDRDSSVKVDGSVHSNAEGIFDRLIRGFDLKGSEEGTFFSESLLEPEIGDFLGGRVDLLVIIPVEFMVKNPLGLFDLGDILSDTGSNQSVLEPPIGSFDFTLAWGERE
jgi:hypothetical protein